MITLPNGDIQQIRDTGRPPKPEDPSINPTLSISSLESESFRIISGTGTVIRHLKNGTIQTLFANGNSAVLKKGKKWVSVNSHGHRRAKNLETGGLTELDPIPCTIRFNPETEIRTLYREDGVTVAKKMDGTTITTHADGTKMTSSEKGESIRVEHPQYSTVSVKTSEYRMRNSSVIGNDGNFSDRFQNWRRPRFHCFFSTWKDTTLKMMV